MNSTSTPNTSGKPVVPDAMNQTIFKMMTQETGPQATSRQLSSLYTQSINTLPEHRRKQTFNTGINPYVKYMPYPLPWRAVAGPEELPPDFGWITNSCAGKAIVGTIGGAVAGLVMGVFLGAMSGKFFNSNCNFSFQIFCILPFIATK